MLLTILMRAMMQQRLIKGEYDDNKDGVPVGIATQQQRNREVATVAVVNENSIVAAAVDLATGRENAKDIMREKE